MEKIGNRFEVLGTLGAGGMGVVYKARDPNLKRLVAIKVQLEEFSAKPEFRERFVREAQAASELEHQNIVKIYDIQGVEDGSQPYIVMEYLEGRNLKEEIETNEKLPLERRLAIMLEICDGLHCA